MAIDPLADRYPGLSPYNYCINNPLILFDPNGKGVFVTGNDADKAIKEMNKNLSFELRRDNETGLISAYNSDGMPITSIEGYEGMEQQLLSAMFSTSVETELSTTSSNQSPEGDYFGVGYFGGSEKIIGGSAVWATNGLNVDHAAKLASIGGGSIGQSALHEVLEANYGGVHFPGEKYIDNNSNPYLGSHNYASEMVKTEKQFVFNHNPVSGNASLGNINQDGLYIPAVILYNSKRGLFK